MAMVAEPNRDPVYAICDICTNSYPKWKGIAVADKVLCPQCANGIAGQELRDGVEESYENKKPLLPLSSPAFLGVLGQYAKLLAPAREADPGWILAAAVVGSGFLMGKEPYYNMGGQKQHTNLFAVAVGRTGDRKTAPWTEFERRVVRRQAIAPPLSGLLPGIKAELSKREADRLQANDQIMESQGITSGFASGESLIRRIAAHSSLGIPMILVEPEFASLLTTAQREGMILGHNLRQAYDGSETRLEYHSQTKGDVIATDHHFSLYSNVTPEELKDKLTAGEAANGFGNRFLWIYGETRQQVTFNRDDLDYTEEELAELTDAEREEVLAQLDDLPGVPEDMMREVVDEIIKRTEAASHRSQVRMHPDATELFRDYVAEKMADDPGGLATPMIARADNHMIRIALIYALMDGSTFIRRTHLEAAHALWRHCRDTAAFLWSKQDDDRFDAARTDSQFQRVLKHVYDMCEAAGDDGVTKGIIRDNLRSRRRLQVFLPKAYEYLVEHKVIEIVCEKEGMAQWCYFIKRNEKGEVT